MNKSYVEGGKYPMQIHLKYFASIRIPNATKCNPPNTSGNRSKSRAKRRNRVIQPKERSTTQRIGNNKNWSEPQS